MNGGAAAVAGAAIWMDAAAARLMLRADETSVYFLGHPIAWTCWMRTHLGVPCPTCGLTRGLVLSLHGRWGEAWRFFPAAPVALVGALALASALLALAVCQASESRMAQAGGRIRKAALVWAAATAVLWIGGWVLRVML